MKRLLPLVLVGMVLLSATPALADDGFYVIPIRAAPGTAIASLPYPITVLGGTITSPAISPIPGGNGITVSADNVTIDLMGFTLSGPEGGGRRRRGSG